MAGLTAPRNTPELAEDREYNYPVEAATSIYIGALCGLNANGNAVPMSAATGLKVVGRAEEMYNSEYPGENPLNVSTLNIPGTNLPRGAAGAISVKLRRGIFMMANSSAHPVAQANVGAPCFAEDDHTVAATDETATLSCAGRVVGIDISGGVWVDTRFPFAIAT